MASGIFLVGDGLSLPGFEHYVHPLLDSSQVSIPDIFPTGRFRPSGILVSLVGAVDLKSILNKVLVNAGKQIEEERASHPEWNQVSFNPEWVSWEHQVRDYHCVLDPKTKNYSGKYKVHGIFSEDGAASKVFPEIAVCYASESAQEKIEELVRKIKSEIGSLARKLNG